MKISLKNKDCIGLKRTVNGYIHLQTEIVEGKFNIDDSVSMIGSISYEGTEFQIHTGYDQLILSFGNSSHIFVTTTNNGDAVGTNGWRHAAHQIGLHFTGEDVVSDASRYSIQEEKLNNISSTIIEHIHKLVYINYISINENDHSKNHKEKISSMRI